MYGGTGRVNSKIVCLARIYGDQQILRKSKSASRQSRNINGKVESFAHSAIAYM